MRKGVYIGAAVLAIVGAGAGVYVGAGGSGGGHVGRPGSSTYVGASEPDAGVSTPTFCTAVPGATHCVALQETSDATQAADIGSSSLIWQTVGDAQLGHDSTEIATAGELELLLDGIGDYLEATTSEAVPTSDGTLLHFTVTMSFVCYGGDITNGERLFSHGTGAMYAAIRANKPAADVRLEMRASSGSAKSATGSTSVCDGVQHCYSAVMDGSGATASALYLDGGTEIAAADLTTATGFNGVSSAPTVGAAGGGGAETRMKVAWFVIHGSKSLDATGHAATCAGSY